MSLSVGSGGYIERSSTPGMSKTNSDGDETEESSSLISRGKSIIGKLAS